MTKHQTATTETHDTPLTSKEDKTMSVKFLVLYPTPTDLEQFDRRYVRDHLPMGKANLIGATGLASYRILGSPAGKSPFARLTEVSSAATRLRDGCGTATSTDDPL